MRGLCGEGSSCKLLDAKEKGGVVAMRLQEGAYFCRVAATVPPTYPEVMADVRVEDSNLPPALMPEFTLRMKVR